MHNIHTQKHYLSQLCGLLTRPVFEFFLPASQGCSRLAVLLGLLRCKLQPGSHLSQGIQQQSAVRMHRKRCITHATKYVSITKLKERTNTASNNSSRDAFLTIGVANACIPNMLPPLHVTSSTR